MMTSPRNSLIENTPHSQPAEAKPDIVNGLFPVEARYGIGVPELADSMNQRSQEEIKIIVWTVCSLSSFSTSSQPSEWLDFDYLSASLDLWLKL